MFQHTAARRRLLATTRTVPRILLFQHTAARRRLLLALSIKLFHFSVSTHSRPKAAAFLRAWALPEIMRFQHTAARRRLRICWCTSKAPIKRFQHTAARRRLPFARAGRTILAQVSTHSRPKAAAKARKNTVAASKFQHTAARRRLRIEIMPNFRNSGFQHTAARRRLHVIHV